jgi:hypothetical protein
MLKLMAIKPLWVIDLWCYIWIFEMFLSHNSHGLIGICHRANIHPIKNVAQYLHFPFLCKKELIFRNVNWHLLNNNNKVFFFFFHKNVDTLEQEMRFLFKKLIVSFWKSNLFKNSIFLLNQVEVQSFAYFLAYKIQIVYHTFSLGL